MTASSGPLINPGAEVLGVHNAILWGRGRRQYHVREFPGPLSLKALIRGSADWTIGTKRFTLNSSTWLVVNDRQPYSITVDSRHAVETFCVFFERGYVEDAYRAITQPDEALLDEPFLESAPELGFSEHVHGPHGPVLPLLHRLHRSVSAGRDCDALLPRLAGELIRQRAEVPRLIARLPAAKAATRQELFRRILEGRHWLDEFLTEGPRLAGAARAACLSPFHFQRLFKAAFHETPQEYVSRRRLELAACLLASNDAPVTEVCLDSGFQSPGTFSTVFRARFGMPPRAYRREFARSKKFFPVA